MKYVSYSLEARGALLLGSHAAGALVVDMALVHVREMTLWCRALIVALLRTSHQVLLNADTEIPVGSGNVHQPGQGVVPGHVLHLGEVCQLSPRGPLCRGLVY